MLILVFHLLVKKECLLDSLDPVLPSEDLCYVSFCEISEAQRSLPVEMCLLGPNPLICKIHLILHSGAPEILHVSFDPGWHSVPRSQ